MNEQLHEQLDKILALADSSHEGEAVGAVRKARQILTRDGLRFSDLARAAYARQSQTKSVGMFSFLSNQRDHHEAHMDHLKQQINDLKAQMQTQDLQLDFWRRRATDLEQNTANAQQESERWKQLAKETAERLWTIKKSIETDDLATEAEIIKNQNVGPIVTSG